MVSLPSHLRSSPVGKQRLPEEARDQYRRARALDAAADVFAKRGYLGTTVDHIVAAAGIGVGSFYELFGSKQDCFLRVYARFVDEVRERLKLAAQGADDPPAQVCACLKVVLDVLRTDEAGARLALIEVQSAGPRAVGLHQQNLEAAVPLLRRCRSLSPYGEQLPLTLEYAIVGGVAWLAHQRLALREKDAPDSLYPELVDIVLGPYFGEAEVARLAAEL